MVHLPQGSPWNTAVVHIGVVKRKALSGFIVVIKYAIRILRYNGTAFAPSLGIHVSSYRGRGFLLVHYGSDKRCHLHIFAHPLVRLALASGLKATTAQRSRKPQGKDGSIAHNGVKSLFLAAVQEALHFLQKRLRKGAGRCPDGWENRSMVSSPARWRMFAATNQAGKVGCFQSMFYPLSSMPCAFQVSGFHLVPCFQQHWEPLRLKNFADNAKCFLQWKQAGRRRHPYAKPLVRRQLKFSSRPQRMR